MAYMLLVLGTVAYEYGLDNNFLGTRKTLKFYKGSSIGRPERLIYTQVQQVTHLNELEIFLLREVFVLQGKTMHALFTSSQCYRHLPAIHHTSVLSQREKLAKKRSDRMSEMDVVDTGNEYEVNTCILLLTTLTSSSL